MGASGLAVGVAEHRAQEDPVTVSVPELNCHLPLKLNCHLPLKMYPP